MVNRVLLVGRVGRDPEVRFTESGQAVANVSLATDESRKDKNGKRQKTTTWHKVIAWGKLAEIIQQYVKKGALIYIEGRIQSREWQDKQGQKRTAFEIIADTMKILEGKANGTAASGTAAREPGADAGEDLAWLDSPQQ